MISHKYKCIFIHIPRVAGTSIEQWICGEDWWSIQPSTKHLLASQAKELYREYWDDYFTFSFVRNPWDRVVSGLKFQGYFGIHYQKCDLPPRYRCLDFRGYEQLFGADRVILELDHRFYQRRDLILQKHKPNRVYGNILDQELDFVGRFESLEEDCKKIGEILGIDREMNIHTEKSERNRNYRTYYDENAIKKVRELYAKDIEHYNYVY